MITTPKPGKPPAEMKAKMNNDDSNIDWSKTTWEGSRREQLRRWRKLTLRERLQAVEDMTDISQHFEEMRERRESGDNAISTDRHD